MDLSKAIRWAAELGVSPGQPDSKAACSPGLRLTALEHSEHLSIVLSGKANTPDMLGTSQARDD